MYVAITPARRRLYLSHAQSRMLPGQVRYGLPSRFLDELAEPVLCRFNPPQRIRASSLCRSARPLTRKHLGPSGTDTCYRVGQSVAHAKFGTRHHHRLRGGGPDARVQ